MVEGTQLIAVRSYSNSESKIKRKSGTNLLHNLQTGFHASENMLRDIQTLESFLLCVI